jgi:hypothetical protein
MRKALTMLGAIAALALGSLLGASAANATTCVTAPSAPLTVPPVLNINEWPRMVELGSSPAKSSLYYCGSFANPSSDSAFSVVWQAAQKIGKTGTNVPPDYVANIFYNGKQRVYFFETFADAKAYLNLPFSPPAGQEPYGVTLDRNYGSTPAGTVIFWRTTSQGLVLTPNMLKGTVYHELGHAYARLKGINATSTNWALSRDTDILNLNNTGKNLADKGRAQVFGRYNVSAKYSSCMSIYNDLTKTHWQVAQCMWPHYTQDFELFGNVFGMKIGNVLSDPAIAPKLYDFGQFLVENFKKSFLYIYSVTDGGAI